MSAVLKRTLAGLVVFVVALAIVDVVGYVRAPSIAMSITVWPSEFQAAVQQMSHADTPQEVLSGVVHLTTALLISLGVALILVTIVIRLLGAILGLAALTLVRGLVVVCGATTTAPADRMISALSKRRGGIIMDHDAKIDAVEAANRKRRETWIERPPVFGHFGHCAQAEDKPPADEKDNQDDDAAGASVARA